MPRYVDAQELAEIFKVSQRTILSWHRRGLIPSVSVAGKTVRFHLAEVEEMLKRKRKAKGKVKGTRGGSENR